MQKRCKSSIFDDVNVHFVMSSLNTSTFAKKPRFYDRRTDGQMARQKLRFWSARRLMMLYISMKCHENVLKSGHEMIIVKFQKGNNSKNV